MQAICLCELCFSVTLDLSEFVHTFSCSDLFTEETVVFLKTFENTRLVCFASSVLCSSFHMKIK